ncbi:MAG: DUF4112 domain-containing protein [Saprospiraceae bacterium]
MENQVLTKDVPEFKYLDILSSLLDNRFRIPGTNIRFGLDFLIGLVPFAGDVLTFSFSGMLVIAMARHGASGRVIVKMLGNILVDTTVGTIPILGDLFDLGFKANRRNYHLLREHYDEQKHKGSAWPVIITVFLILLLMLAFVVFIAWELFRWVFS